MVLFKNPRDNYQILLIARQMFLCKTKYFLDSFNNATSMLYEYLLVDFEATTPDNMGHRTAILSDRKVVYTQRAK